MSTTSIPPEARSARDIGLLSRILDEGFGQGAWHGADLKQALEGVTPELAFWRPSPERHNIAEIAAHHAYYVRSVRGRLGGDTSEPFFLEGDDWFPVSARGGPSWLEIRGTLENEQRKLASLVADLDARRAKSSLAESERLDVILGISCHAIYHAGQVQILKVLHG